MKSLKGYRTLIVNVLMMIAAILGIWGIDFPKDQIGVVATGIVSVMALVNMYMRKITDTKIGRKR